MGSGQILCYNIYEITWKRNKKNIVKKGFIKMIATVAIVFICPKKTSILHCLEKKNTTIESPLRFDRRSCLTTYNSKDIYNLMDRMPYHIWSHAIGDIEAEKQSCLVLSLYHRGRPKWWRRSIGTCGYTISLEHTGWLKGADQRVIRRV